MVVKINLVFIFKLEDKMFNFKHFFGKTVILVIFIWDKTTTKHCTLPFQSLTPEFVRVNYLQLQVERFVTKPKGISLVLENQNCSLNIHQSFEL